jgi:hypothetical protein
MRRTAAITTPISEAEVEVECWRMIETDLVIPMTPSPMMINVNSPMRSTRCVCLKLTTLSTHDIAMMAVASQHTTTYLIIVRVCPHAGS